MIGAHNFPNRREQRCYGDRYDKTHYLESHSSEYSTHEEANDNLKRHCMLSTQHTKDAS